MLQQELTSFAPDLGNVFCYGLLQCNKDNQNFVCEVISTALQTVTEKQGIKKAFGRILCDIWPIYVFYERPTALQKFLRYGKKKTIEGRYLFLTWQ